MCSPSSKSRSSCGSGRCPGPRHRAAQPIGPFQCKQTHEKPPFAEAGSRRPGEDGRLGHVVVRRRATLRFPTANLPPEPVDFGRMPTSQPFSSRKLAQASSACSTASPAPSRAPRFAHAIASTRRLPRRQGCDCLRECTPADRRNLPEPTFHFRHLRLGLGSGISVMVASVNSKMLATDTAFSSAMRTTLVGIDDAGLRPDRHIALRPASKP